MALKKFILITLYLWSAFSPLSAWAQTEEQTIHTSHGITLFGELKYGPDFKHFDYVNPDAPKGGTFVFSFGTSFDSFNSFIVLGTPAAFRRIDVILYDRLMVRSGDEPASLYGLVAETISYPDDYSWVEFKLREGARFHDGKTVTVDDVIFSLEILKSKGSPEYRTNYGDVIESKQTGPDTVRFILSEKNNRGIPYTIAQLPVLPRHFWQGRDFTKATLEPPLTSGPYRITKVDPGRSYTLERVKDYWARDLPVNKGRYNFDIIQHDYYRDISVNFESFMAGNSDLRWETLPQQWTNGYDVPAVKDGRLIKEMLKFAGTVFDVGLYMNSRLEKFKDPKVREAITYAFDFEWINKTILHNQWRRLRSHFDNSELAHTGVPEGLELELLEPYRDQLDHRVFTEEWNPPKTDATQASLRRNLRKAAMLLREAGYTMRDGKQYSRDGKHLEFEILLWDPFFERITASFVANLKLLGVTAHMRLVDSAEWIRRMRSFEYEMGQGLLQPMSLSPGKEQREIWGSAAADQQGSRNWMGIKDPVVDALIEKIVYAPDRETVVAATRALDRVLCWGFYYVPHAYADGIPIAYWNRFGRPQRDPLWLKIIWYMSHWWIDPEKDAALMKAGGKRAK